MSSTEHLHHRKENPESSRPLVDAQGVGGSPVGTGAHPGRVQGASGGESTGGEGRNTAGRSLPEHGPRLYTVVSGGYESGPGWRTELAVVTAVDHEAAVSAFLATFGHAADDARTRADVEVFPGVHRPVLAGYFAPPFLDQLVAAWPFTGGVALRWTLRRG